MNDRYKTEPMNTPEQERSMNDAKYLPKGEDIFSCIKCKMHFVLPSCCDHYQQDKITKLESQPTEKDALLKKLEAKIEELEKDRVRLDWLESKPDYVQISVNELLLIYKSDIRGAIDEITRREK